MRTHFIGALLYVLIYPYFLIFSVTSPLAELRPMALPADLQFQEDSTWPIWFRKTQRQAWTQFLSIPAPTRTQEAWRFSNTRALDLSNLCYQTPAISTSLVENSPGLSPDTSRLIFANHILIARETKDRLPRDVVVAPLKSAIRTHENLIQQYFMNQPVELGSQKYALWHRACLRDGAFIYVPPNTTVEIPIEIFSWLEGTHSVLFPHTLIVCGENSRVTVLEHFRAASDAQGFVCGINDLHLAAGAEVTYAAIQDWNLAIRALHLNSTLVAENAKATVFQANFGASFLRSESLSRLTGCGARSLMLSLTPASGTREIDQRTLQDHVAPNTSSDLLYHNVLDDFARTIFAGLIRVERDAHQTDAYQKVRNLLLSDAAEANSMPGLEILADNVRCTHGATSGQINDDELFYMKTRGISATQGRRLIANGFLASVLERVDDIALREFIAHRLYKAKN